VSLIFDGFELDLDRYELRGVDGPIALEPQAFEVLALLVGNRERVVSKQELLDHVWESQFVSDSALTTRIKEVRRALGNDGRAQRFVRTVHRRGYHFIAEVSETEAALQAHGKTIADAPSAAFAPSEQAATVEAPSGFVSRQAELERLRVALDTAMGGSGGVVLLAGEPGIGTTATVRQLEALAAERHPITRRCRSARHHATATTSFESVGADVFRQQLEGANG
jgi:DNA-binding winged helix-turn-helix (wHTH) protein